MSLAAGFSCVNRLRVSPGTSGKVEPVSSAECFSRCFAPASTTSKSAKVSTSGPFNQRFAPHRRSQQVQPAIRRGSLARCNAGFGGYCPIDDDDKEECSILNLTNLKELLTELVALLAEFDEPFEGALTAQVFLDTPSSSSDKNAVQLSVEIFTRDELLYQETRDIIRHSAIEDMDPEVQLVLIVQRLHVETMTVLPDPWWNSTVFVSGSVPRHALEWEFDLFSQFERLGEEEDEVAMSNGTLLQRPQSHISPSSPYLPSDASCSAATGAPQHPEAPEPSNSETFGVVVIQPSGKQHYLLAEKKHAGAAEGEGGEPGQGPKARAGTGGDEAAAMPADPAGKVKVDVKYAIYDETLRDALELLQ